MRTQNDFKDKVIKHILFGLLILEVCFLGYVTALLNSFEYPEPQIFVPQKELSIEEKIKEIFPENYELMIAIAKAESGLNPNAVNATDGHATCTGSYGLFQIGCVHSNNPSELLDVDTNIEYARDVYDEQGLDAWTVYTKGYYLAYLN